MTSKASPQAVVELAFNAQVEAAERWKSVAAYATTARSRNTREWMVGLAERLSAATGQAWRYSRIDDQLVVEGGKS